MSKWKLVNITRCETTFKREDVEIEVGVDGTVAKGGSILGTLDPDILTMLEEITEENIPDSIASILDDPQWKPLWDAIDAMLNVSGNMSIRNDDDDNTGLTRRPGSPFYVTLLPRKKF